MINSSRPKAASQQSALTNTALGLLLCAVSLITLALTLADDLGDPAFFALIGAELVLVAGMGAIAGTAYTQNTADAAQRQRDEAALATLEPLHGGEQR
ncbi:hypothetical protein [Streptomyces sp. URMC 124]|uniref:hypothetical protein n=1 Tax=Streptomyces sp. URMC 124 TaxID=3423405 RepID=UPI003F1A040D